MGTKDTWTNMESSVPCWPSQAGFPARHAALCHAAEPRCVPPGHSSQQHPLALQAAVQGLLQSCRGQVELQAFTDHAKASL